MILSYLDFYISVFYDRKGKIILIKTYKGLGLKV